MNIAKDITDPDFAIGFFVFYFFYLLLLPQSLISYRFTFIIIKVTQSRQNETTNGTAVTSAQHQKKHHKLQQVPKSWTNFNLIRFDWPCNNLVQSFVWFSTNESVSDWQDKRMIRSDSDENYENRVNLGLIRIKMLFSSGVVQQPCAACPVN